MNYKPVIISVSVQFKLMSLEIYSRYMKVVVVASNIMHLPRVNALTFVRTVDVIYHNLSNQLILLWHFHIWVQALRSGWGDNYMSKKWLSVKAGD